ncbi:MAG TPA: prenyltransferase/squalene oxidase repeat-containing protein [Pirellulales bacterium]|jgi:hypothetical protein|nr:prenyltransferase/squalene oxidase repeat-containing protein [Pirellulales bacterium]
MCRIRGTKVRRDLFGLMVVLLAAWGAEGLLARSAALAQAPAPPQAAPDDSPIARPESSQTDPFGEDAPDENAPKAKDNEITPPPMAPEIGLPAIKEEGTYACRSPKHRRELLKQFGGTRATERAAAAALYWLAKHQMPDGSWSLEKFQKMCTDKSCTGVGSIESLSAATGLGLLPFLAAGQTQATNGPFQRKVAAGVYWLLNHQKRDGDLSADAASQMYSHAIATIALCEDYGMTKDKPVGVAAQMAVNFIVAAQNQKTGGWRYHPGEEGDTSVLGWQMQALHAAQEAGLTVKPAALDGAKNFLASCQPAEHVGWFCYQPEAGATPPMTAVGLLASQDLKMDRTDPVILGGSALLLANQPQAENRNIYYWYYATQALHNLAGKESEFTSNKNWDTWNRKIRKLLVETQAREGCAAGSWDPDKPNKDAWGPYGGRIMQTSLSCLTLEIYYRHLPAALPEKP